MYFCFEDSRRLRLSGNHRVTSFANIGVICGEFKEIRSFWTRGQVFPGAKGLWNDSGVYKVKGRGIGERA